MNTNDTFIRTPFDKLLFIILLIGFTNLFVLWFICNILRSNNEILWISSLPISIFIVLLTNGFHFPLPFQQKTISLPHLLFFFLLTITILFYLQPILINPSLPIGIPNKDMHDGIVTFINRNGFPPVEINVISPFATYIPVDKTVFLGYPNMAHVFAAFLMKIGISSFSATWVEAVVVLAFTSIGLNLILNFIFRNSWSTSIIAGLFGLSTFRLPYTFTTSYPMFFSYMLILPFIAVFLGVIHNSKSIVSRIFLGIALAVVAASYSSIWFACLIFMIVYALILLWQKKQENSTASLYAILVCVPFLILVFCYQNHIYWQNTFPTAIDYDPYEPSQILQPFDKPIYMIIYLYALILNIYYLFKNKITGSAKTLHIVILIIQFGIMALIGYVLLFFFINQITTQNELIRLDPNGLFGALNLQKVQRLLLLEPYIYILIFGVFSHIPISKIAVYVCTFFIMTFGLFRIDIPLYSVFKLNDSTLQTLYNVGDENKAITLMSHYRFIVPKMLWTENIVRALKYVKLHNTANFDVNVWDKRGWSRQSIVGWSSVYLEKKVGSINSYKAFLPKAPTYLIVIYPSPEERIGNSNSTRVYENEDVIVYFASF